MIKLVTLDLDNTLWDAEPTIHQAHRDMVAWLVAQRPESTELLTPKVWAGLRRTLQAQQPEILYHPTAVRKAMLQLALAPLQLPIPQQQDLVEGAFEVFYDGRNQVKPYPEAITLLEHLATRVPVVAITNGNANLERIGIDQYFKAIVNAERAGVAKPHPGIFHLALSLGGNVSAQDALHVGDHALEDVEASKALGFQTVWLKSGALDTTQHCEPTATAESISELVAIIQAIVP
ncbi:HAD-superfamily hydrolase [gamma proteobacterium HdN1]|nr:HAD-superfamily hydrolase [gamma proteobacterium HdN1]